MAGNDKGLANIQSCTPRKPESRFEMALDHSLPKRALTGPRQKSLGQRYEISGL